MPHLFDTLIRCAAARWLGAAARLADVALRDGRIARIDEPGAIDPDSASNVVEGHGLVLSPGLSTSIRTTTPMSCVSRR
jgi:amidohydrolase/N-acyl-D-amino-acid deacylase